MEEFNVIGTLLDANQRLNEEVKALKSWNEDLLIKALKSWNEDLLIEKLVLKEDVDLLKKQIKELENALYQLTRLDRDPNLAELTVSSKNISDPEELVG